MAYGILAGYSNTTLTGSGLDPLPLSLFEAIVAMASAKQASAQANLDRLADATWPCEMARDGWRSVIESMERVMLTAGTREIDLKDAGLKANREHMTTSYKSAIATAWSYAKRTGQFDAIPESLLDFAGLGNEYRDLMKARQLGAL